MLHRRITILILGLVSSSFIGCEPSASSTPSPSAGAVAPPATTTGGKLPLGHYPALTKADIAGLFCNARVAAGDGMDQFEWIFKEDAVTISGTMMPSSLLDTFGLTETPADAIQCQWTLDGNKLVLTAIRIGDQPAAVESVTLSIFRSAPTIQRINLGDDQYVFVH